MPAPKRKAAAQATAGNDKKQMQFKDKLMKVAADMLKADKGKIGLSAAHRIWKSALDGYMVTKKEFATLREILDKYEFNDAGKKFLGELATKYKSGVSKYQQIDGKKYERSLLDLAHHLSKDGSLNKQNAVELWAEALDGRGVSVIEAATIRYIQARFELTAGAHQYLRAMLEDWEASARGPPMEAPKNDLAGGWHLDFGKEPTEPKSEESKTEEVKTETKNEAMETELNLKDKLMKKAETLKELDEGILGLSAAHTLWNTARDGHQVTAKEFATLRHILDTYEFTPVARKFLTNLATLTKSGKSQYQQIDGVKYDRSCLDLAKHLAKDGSINVRNAESLWPEVLDGPGVTETEANTIRYISALYRLTKGLHPIPRQSLRRNLCYVTGARFYLRAKLEDWEASARGPAVDPPNPEENPTAAAAGGWNVKA